MKSFFTKNYFKIILFFVCFLLPVLWAFRHIFFGQLPTWGDAPYFYSETLSGFYSKLSTWTYRGPILGGIDYALWLYPIMFLMGSIHKFFGLGSDTIIRFIFYFPAIILSGLGPYLLAKHLGFPKVVSIFSSLFYIFNTYFLLIIDGGQVGVALAYGIFPLVILLGKKLLSKPHLLNFICFVVVSFLITIVDPRISLISYMLLFVWQIFDDGKKIWFLLASGFILIPLNFYWLYPLIKISGPVLSLGVANLQLSALLNALLLYAPHWPGNLFGKVVQPSFIFVVFPFLVFGSLIFVKTRKILILCLLFLFFAFLSKGSTPPQGGWYDLIIKLPFGFAFRDSSKFFIPLTLIGGILIGRTVDVIRSKFKLFPVFIYLFLLFSVSPVFLGKVNFVLSDRKVGNDFQVIYQNVSKQNSFFRTLWFSEKHPLAFESENHPTADARDLVNLKPIESLNASEDLFNFLNSPNYLKWLKVFGFKYLILSGDPRNPKPNSEDVKNWETLEGLVAKTSGLIKLNWGTSFPIYEISDNFPKTYSVKNIVAVVGPFVDSTRPAVYFEDGIFDPYLLAGKNPESTKIFFNGKDKDDLTMSLLQKYFILPSDSTFSNWIVFGHGDTLKAKYELLVRGFEYKDFDYGRGIALSTKIGEIIKFKFNISANGKYILAVRKASKEKQSFHWIFSEKDLKKGTFENEVLNTSGLEVFNTIALIPVNEWAKTEKISQEYINRFGTIGVQSMQDLKIKDINPKDGWWQILNESYNPIWKSIPVYSTINGIYNDRKN